MENLTQNVAGALQILICVSIVLILIIGIFLIKLLLDTSNLVKSLQDFIKITHAELEPAIKEINGTLININSISSGVSEQFAFFNTGMQKGGRFIAKSADKTYKQLKIAGLYAKGGLFSAINVLLKNK